MAALLGKVELYLLCFHQLLHLSVLQKEPSTVWCSVPPPPVIPTIDNFNKTCRYGGETDYWTIHKVRWTALVMLGFVPEQLVCSHLHLPFDESVHTKSIALGVLSVFASFTTQGHCYNSYLAYDIKTGWVSGTEFLNTSGLESVLLY